MAVGELAGWRRVWKGPAGLVGGPVRRWRSVARRSLRGLGVLAGVPVLTLGLTAGTAAASGGGRVTIYPGISYPHEITVGPGGALWFTNYDGNSIGRITAHRKLTDYSGAQVRGPWGIAAGPDGALWFTNQGNNSIGRITTTGQITNYTAPNINGPYGITAGPDKALWFTNIDAIGRITTALTPADQRIDYRRVTR
jgi:streptogramin lyase